MRTLLSADCTVVFNEIMYNPAGTDETLEFVELTNQMAVDMDISAWRFTDGIDYEFPEGTFIPGGGYLVVARNPIAFEAATGISDAYGPYGGQLSNGGEQVELRDRTDRLMDVVDYNDGGSWPTAPDGSGASLAKMDPGTPSGPAENWTFSAQVGGTPGQRNTPDPSAPPEVTALVDLDAQWKYEASGTDLDTAWRAAGYNDSGWNSAPAPFYAETPEKQSKLTDLVDGRLTADNYFAVYVGAADGTDLRLIGRDSVSDWTSVEYFNNVEIRPDDHIYLAAWEAPGSDGGPQMLIGEFDLPDSTKLSTNIADWEWVIGPTGATPGDLLSDPPPPISELQTLISDANAGATWAAPQVSLDRYSSPWGSQIGSSFSESTRYIWPDTFGSVSITNTYETYALFRSVESVLPAAGNTELPLGPTTYYFRTEFDFDGALALTELTLDVAIDDGAVFYLNGEEVYSQNMPSGTVEYSTLASDEVEEASFTYYISIPTDHLVQGTNLLAVEVHQAAAEDGDMFFGAELTSKVWPPSPEQLWMELTFNEVESASEDAFWVELVNYSDGPIDVGGFLLASSTGDEYELPAQTLASGEYLVLGEAQIAFQPDEGDRLFL
ncbi:MAG: hypothetical protein A2V70_05730, partial [Planctomycetes bacterium RBG_13_63_9]